MSNDYRPSLASAQKALGAVPAVRKDYPGGAKGVHFSLEEMARRIRDGRNDPYIRAFAAKTVTAAGVRDKGVRAQTQALLDRVRKDVMYAPDPVGTEMVVSPRHTLCLDENSLCMKIGDCDDLVVALASLLLSIGIPVQIVAQSFDASGVPSHVLLAVRDGNAWLKADPSTKLDVGRAHPATKEMWADPLEEHLSQLEESGAAGDFVGIGHVGVGDLLTDAQKKALFDTATAQVKVAVFLLTKATNDLAASLTTIDQTRRALRPTNPYDLEPANPIDNFLALPSGVWTQNEANLAMGLYNTCATVARAGNQALDGSRRILLDGDANEIFLEVIAGDPWSLRQVFKGATDDVIAIFQPPSSATPAGGFTSKGKVLTGKQVEDTVDVLKTGVGAAPLVILGVAAAIAFTSIAICYVLIRQAEATKSAAYEATYQSVLQALAQGKMTPDQANAILVTIGKNQIAIQKAEADNKKADPFASTVESVGSIVKWSVVGAIVVGGAYLAAPLIKETIHDFRANRMRALRKY